jgi:hypothetical protein
MFGKYRIANTPATPTAYSFGSPSTSFLSPAVASAQSYHTTLIFAVLLKIISKSQNSWLQDLTQRKIYAPSDGTLLVFRLSFNFDN